MIQITDLNQLI